MLYRSLMTSTVWPSTLWMSCVYAYVHFVCECVYCCSCLHLIVSVCIYRQYLLYMCVCVCVAVYLLTHGACESKRSSFVVWWWTGCLRLTGLHLYRLHCKSVCVGKAGQQGGGAPCLSVRHCCCVLQHLVGQFCFNRQQKCQEEKGLKGAVGLYLVSLICTLKYT